MKVKTELKHSMLTYPCLYPNALFVYNHWFLSIGNGYEWKNGELVECCPSKLCKSQQKAINKIMIKNFTGDGMKSLKSMIDAIGEENAFNLYIKPHIFEEEIERVINYKKNSKDFSIIKDKKYNIFSFYPLSTYARIYTIPDDVKDDWLEAAHKMVEIMDMHVDMLEDKDNIFPKIKNRVNTLWNKRNEKNI